MKRSKLGITAIAVGALALSASLPSEMVTAQSVSPTVPHPPKVAPAKWAQLPEAYKQALAPLAEDYDQMDISQKQRWLGIANNYPALSPLAQQRAQEKMKQWALLTPDQRRQARVGYRKATQTPQNERLAQWEEYQTLSEEQKKVLTQYGVGHETAAVRSQVKSGLSRSAAKPLASKVAANPAPDEHH